MSAPDSSSVVSAISPCARAAIKETSTAPVQAARNRMEFSGGPG
jgi:hypothetical protein